MMLDEAITHAEEVYKNKKSDAEEARLQEQDAYANECMKCALEHSQLAEWLWELKRRREGKWILCSERPPKKEGFYLITVDENDRKDVHEAFFYFRKDGTPSWYCENSVVAWMPLPQPWGGEQND